ncbi:MAG TPA: iron-sulfur cluster assembly scaffold protein [Desulfobacteraceae bacterium]|nr:iron-sulfur cluster assembly scaffold protein [Desulfobacteraceae bacterium]|tara:strand:- start:1058 stop:1444 length:387 start_codon:yes stop_codon:yes gene_type:complete
MENQGFWNTHSLRFLEMAYEAGFIERIENPDGYGSRTGDCGDRVAFFIMVEAGLLTHISFEVDGCLNTVACCNTVVRLARGLSIEAAWDITPDQVDAYLETLPEDHYHCAELSVGGFYLALKDYASKS